MPTRCWKANLRESDGKDVGRNPSPNKAFMESSMLCNICKLNFQSVFLLEDMASPTEEFSLLIFFLRISNLHVMCFDQIHVPLFYPQFFPIASNTFTLDSMCCVFNSTESTQCCLYVHGFLVVNWRMNNISLVASLENTDSPSPSSKYFLIQP